MTDPRTPADEHETAPPGEVAWWCIVLPLGLIAVYAICSFATAGRRDVAAPCFGFESRIPLVPWTILPYLMLDPLVVAALALCPDRRALRRLVVSMAAAGLLCAAGFLLFPMRLALPETPLGSMFTGLFAMVQAVDQSYNRCPSLHVALTVLIWPVYAQRGSILRRLLVHTSLALVVASTLLARRHQVIDVAGGAAVALAARLIARAAVR